MADRRISDLNPAPSTIDDSNTLFAVEQARTAYRVDGHAFITALTTILDGHGGIADIEYTEPSSGSLDGTLTITLADQSTAEFTVKNGKAISSITQYFAVNNSTSSVPTSWSTTRQTITSSNRYLWSYFHFAYNDNTSADTPKTIIGTYGDTGDSWYMWIRYAGQEPTSDSDIGTTPDNWIGIYSGTASTAPTSYTSYTWYEYKGEKGDSGDPATISSQSITYLESSSGTVVPTGSWTTTIPTVTPGNFLWTRTELFFNEGTTVTSYSVSRFGIDGTGAVSTVNNVSPDGNGNIALTASGIPTSDSTSVQSHITDIENAISGVTGATATPLMDGTAAVGSSTKYAREDHVHPTDTSRQETLVSGTNIKTINNNSLLGSGDITIGGAVNSVNGQTGTVVLDADDLSAMHWDLLWTNASPSSSFGAQTIPLDLSPYPYIMLEHHNDTLYFCEILAVGKAARINYLTYNAGNSFAHQRPTTVNTNGVVFDNANMNGNITNTDIVPAHIYGIKGVWSS